MTDPLDAAALRSLSLAATVEVHDELGSTNDRAKQLAADEVSPPALVVADRQTAGRGRGANRWHAGTGSLTFSLLLDPAAHGLTSDRQGLLAVAAGVALVEAVEAAAGVTASLKWPNDVLIDGKKLAGVLIEAPRPDRWVVGVGVNVSTRFDGAPPEVAERAVSLGEAAGRLVGRQTVLEGYLAAFHARLSPTGHAALIDAARSLCVLTGRRVTLRDGSRTFQGECLGWADDGALLLKTEKGVTGFRSGSVVRSD